MEAFVAKTSMLTPHKISLLILIEAYWEIIETDSTTPEKLEPLLFFLIEKISDEQRFPEPTLKELCDELTKISDNTDNTTNNFSEILLAKLVIIVTPHELTFSIKEMKRFFTRDAELFLRKYSLLGIFVRRCILEMNKLMFDDISRLYNAFIEYRDKRTTKPSTLFMKDAYVPLEVSEMTELAQRFHMHKQELIPKNDAESFSHYVITQLRKYGGILPLEIEEKLRKIHDRIPEISSIYYIEFVKYMQTGEYEGALTNFYKYSNFCPDDPENRLIIGYPRSNRNGS